MEFKVITYNIDGLPEVLDLKELPWVFKPLVWIYSKVKGTTVIKVNDNEGTSERMKDIGEYLSFEEADIIGVQEDFNYHTELMEGLPDYKCATYSGGFDLSKVFTSMTWFPLPRFKADGLNLISKKEIEVYSEEIIPWKKSYGYISHANDKLTHKGFRFYTVDIKGVAIDVYVLHMDADFYNPDTCPDVKGDVEARRSQLQQLSEFIIEKHSGNPAIIIGDTNSAEKYEWDRENIMECLLEPINKENHLSIKEALPMNMVDVDRVFYINTLASPFSIDVADCYYDEVTLSDHKPLIAKFSIIYKAV